MANERDAMSQALLAAVNDEDLAPLRALLAGGVDWSGPGQEAAEWGVTNASLPILAALEDAGFPWRAPVPWATSPAEAIPVVDNLLTQALLSGVTTPELVRFLLERGADPNLRVRGRPLLAAFLARGADLDLPVLEALLAAGPDVNAADADGATPLMHAVSRPGDGRLEAVARLLAAGADAGRRDNAGRSAADRAAGLPAPEFVESLRAATRAPARPASAEDPLAALPPGGFFVLRPIGDPPSWRWAGSAEDAEAAHRFVEEHLGWSRGPLGPYPVLQRVSADDAPRPADPFAARQAGRIIPGQLLVLTLTGYAPVDPRADEPGPEPPPPLFALVGIFPGDALAAARAHADSRSGQSCVARLESLIRVTDGYPERVDSLHVG